MPKRKTNGKKKIKVEGVRVAELPHPSRISADDPCMVRGQKQKFSDDDEGSSRPAKKIKLFHHVHSDEEQASSSVETSKDPKTTMPKRKTNGKKKIKVEGVRVAELPHPSRISADDPCMVRGQKQKFSDDDEGSSRPAKKIKLFHHVHSDEEQASSSVETSKDPKTKMPKRKTNGKKKIKVEGVRVAELPHPSRISADDPCMVRGQKQKFSDDDEGSSRPAKKIKLFHHVHSDEEQASSSVETSKDPKTKMPKRKTNGKKKIKVEGVRVAELPHPSRISADDPCMVRGQKRKLSDDDEGSSRPAKKIKLFHHVHTDGEQAILEISTDVKEKVCKRKATGDGKESPPKKPKRSSTKKIVAAKRREFKAKYVEKDELGEGGCGTVFAGYRKEDKFPVAIKHIPRSNVHCKVKVSMQHLNLLYIIALWNDCLFLIIHFVAMFQDENGKRISVEVATMLKLTPETPRSGRTSAAVSLLDWFDLRKELILVMERPVPAVDLWEYIEENGGTLTEETAKAILKQLIEAAKELEDKNIFHRDIKIENILIETGSDVPRVRLIDFGMSCFFKKRSWYRIFSGTPSYCPPEWYLRQYYRPGPTTVWQLGAVLYETLHARPFFDTILVLNELLEISEELSENCQDFLKMCLDLDPKRRPILEDLLLHRWFR
ncbi:uncharacterized protein LOC115775402 isoform X2 [Archocentrus centrarchus]|uniref:uncharacterized protein LOC115775402 isoform X2 n=2 Tax=Archocentrus centrarchus TaxID=63155 RepID=UPI0011EA113A|nr:uncharacterized protein LOC115775402 isoform X2 [Archocentrus centrarchus]